MDSVSSSPQGPRADPIVRRRPPTAGGQDGRQVRQQRLGQVLREDKKGRAADSRQVQFGEDVWFISDLHPKISASAPTKGKPDWCHWAPRQSSTADDHKLRFLSLLLPNGLGSRKTADRDFCQTHTELLQDLTRVQYLELFHSYS